MVRTVLAAAMVGMVAAGMAGAFGTWAAVPFTLDRVPEGWLLRFDDGPTPEHYSACGGLAPVVTYCHNGNHTPWGHYVASLRGFLFPPCGSSLASVPEMDRSCYSGVVEYHLSGPGVNYTRRCLVWFPPVADAPDAQCSYLGIYPWYPSSFEMQCRSSADDTFHLPDGRLLPGGVGEWRCYTWA
jgi:hypothetical protein